MTAARRATTNGATTRPPGKKAGRPKTQPAETQDSPAREEIAMRAYEIHLLRGGTHGHDLDDWLQAETELREAAESPKR